MANTISIIIQAKDDASAVLSATAANLEATASRMEAVGKGFTEVGKTASLGLTLPIAAVGVAAVAMAGNFEQSLNVLQSVTGATTAQMAALRTQAVALGNDITLPGVSASGAAQAMTELAKAGLSVNDVMGAAHGVLALATAGQIDVSDAADVTAQALNAFGLAGSQANTIADLLAASANASTASVQDMALGLQMAGQQSHQMGISLQDTVTALALFSNAGINGSDAGTSLKQMFIQLSTPTTQATALMNQLGLKFYDAKGNFIGLANTAQLLQTKLAGLTVEQKNAALATIFGADSSRVAGVLADSGAAKFNALSVAVNKQGAAAALSAAQNSGFKGALDNLISTVQTSLVDIGTNLLPALTRNLQSMGAEVGKLTAWFDNLTSGQQDMIVKTLTWTAVLGPALFVTGKMVKTVGSLVGVVTAVSKALGFFDAAKLVSQATLATKALGSAGMAGAAEEGAVSIAGSGGLLAALGPLGLTLGAVGLAAGGAYLLYKKFNDESTRFGATDGSGASARTAGSVSMVTLALNAQKDAQSDVQKAITQSTAAAKDNQRANEDLGTTAKSLQTAQTDVTTALQKFGDKSPQYAAATDVLTTTQKAYYQALANTATASLTLSSDQLDLQNKTDALNLSTSNLNSTQDLLKAALDGTAGVIATYGPTALQQVSNIQVLQGTISGLQISWSGFVGPLQGQITQVNDLLFGTGSTISQVQGQAATLNNTLHAAGSSTITIQGSAGGIQGSSSAIQGKRAAGGPVAAGSTYLVGEQGPETFVPSQSGTIIPAGPTKSLLGGASKHVSMTVNNYNNVDVRRMFRTLGMALG